VSKQSHYPVLMNAATVKKKSLFFNALNTELYCLHELWNVETVVKKFINISAANQKEW